MRSLIRAGSRAISTASNSYHNITGCHLRALSLPQSSRHAIHLRRAFCADSGLTAVAAGAAGAPQAAHARAAGTQLLITLPGALERDGTAVRVPLTGTVADLRSCLSAALGVPEVAVVDTLSGAHYTDTSGVCPLSAVPWTVVAGDRVIRVEQAAGWVAPSVAWGAQPVFQPGDGDALGRVKATLIQWGAHRVVSVSMADVQDLARVALAAADGSDDAAAISDAAVHAALREWLPLLAANDIAIEAGKLFRDAPARLVLCAAFHPLADPGHDGSLFPPASEDVWDAAAATAAAATSSGTASDAAPALGSPAGFFVPLPKSALQAPAAASAQDTVVATLAQAQHGAAEAQLVQLNNRAGELRAELTRLSDVGSALLRRAARQVRAGAWLFGTGMVAQWGIIFQLVYETSWDVMEPICYFISTGYAVLGYMFYMWTRRDPAAGNMWNVLLEKRRATLHRRETELPEELRDVAAYEAGLVARLNELRQCRQQAALLRRQLGLDTAATAAAAADPLHSLHAAADDDAVDPLSAALTVAATRRALGLAPSTQDAAQVQSASVDTELAMSGASPSVSTQVAADELTIGASRGMGGITPPGTSV